MPTTVTLIGSATVGAGGASNITFNSIPGTHTDLLIKFSLRNTLAATQDNISVTFNGVTSGYEETLLYGNGSSVLAAQRLSRSDVQYLYQNAANTTADTFSNGEMYIQNYTSSSSKSVHTHSVTGNAGTVGIMAIDGGSATSVTSAITSINLNSNNGNFVQHSTAYLYGIKNS
jgi:hypothetical protein